jgi:hypothetical protein
MCARESLLTPSIGCPVIPAVQTCRGKPQSPVGNSFSFKIRAFRNQQFGPGTRIVQPSCAITLNNSTGGKKFMNLNRELLPGEG